MNRIKVISDSSSDLPKSLAEELSISMIPLIISCDGVEYRDGINITVQEVYDRMLKGDRFTTSQCTPGDLYERFDEYAEKGYDIIYISVSSNLSGTYSSALVAKSQVEEKYPGVRVGVIDSYGGSMGLGWLVIRAAEMAKEGCSFEEIISTIEKAKKHIHYYITVDNFDALIAGGRMPKGVGIFANALDIKPVITVIDGRLELAPKGSKQRGMKKCMGKICEFISGEVVMNERTRVCLAYAYDTEKSGTFSSLLHCRFGRKEDLLARIGTSIGVHGGPTAFAVFIDDYDAAGEMG